MPRLRQTRLPLRRASRFSPTLALLIVLPLLTAGCLSPLAKHATALSAATAPVVDQAAAAYSSANTIHNLRVDSDAFVAFNAPANAPAYNPRTIQPLLTDKQIQVRLTILAAFQEYVKSVVAVTSGTDSPALQAAAKSAGANLASLGNALAPPAPASTASTTTTTSSTASTPAPAISAAVQNGISSAIDALGHFLVNGKVRKELPHIVVAMDPHVKVLCDYLKSDIAILTEREQHDYDSIINEQTDFVMSNKNLDPGQRRDLIMKLPDIVRQEQVSSEALQQLSASIDHLELTHHAFAADAQGNNPQSLKQKLDELEAAGTDLGNFYSSLSSSTK